MHMQCTRSAHAVHMQCNMQCTACSAQHAVHSMQCTCSAHVGGSFRGEVHRGLCCSPAPRSAAAPPLGGCSPHAVAKSRFVTASAPLHHCRYDKLPLLLPELRFTWVPHKYFLVSPGSLGRTVAAKHVQANYELGGRLHQHANSPAGGRRQSASEQELGTSFDEGMLLMATARRHVHVHRMCCAAWAPHAHRMHTACTACASLPRMSACPAAPPQQHIWWWPLMVP